jgi:protoporphyrinogen oxidase
MASKKAIIIGAGPAGLTAAYELLSRTDVIPLVLEMSDTVGGISRTVNYKGNRMDIGGHRFFSKSDRVMEWWFQRMPVQRHATDGIDAIDPVATDHVMLLRHRKSRIYFLRKFFDYPLRLDAATAANLGITRIVKIVLSYGWAVIFAPRKPKNLEEFFIRRFGRELYLTFFKSYTEKVWGESCSRISAEWGAQRIKGLSIFQSLYHFIKTLVAGKNVDISQKSVETSLIDRFFYPKYGPGQMWEIVAEEIIRRGGSILMDHRVTQLHLREGGIHAVDAINSKNSQRCTYDADYVFSTMPVKELIGAMDVSMPDAVREAAEGLVYRDFITVGLLVKKLKVKENDTHGSTAIRDHWIYIQEPDVKVGRLQIFNNWSPYMVADPETLWLGLEYFCTEGDDLWTLSNEAMLDLAKSELVRIGMIDMGDVLDGTIVRMPKTYPAYFGAYDRFGEIRNFVDQFPNLFLIGRNGMHKYNNQDHSMLAAMTAVDNLVTGRTDNANIWEVNAEMEYHEERQRRFDKEFSEFK